MLEVKKLEKCDWRNGGGHGEGRRGVNERRVRAHRATRKGAGIISSRESANNACPTSFCVFTLFTLTSFIFKTNLSAIYRIARCMMGMMGVFKWLRKDIVQRDRHRRNLSPKFDGLNNDAYRNAIQAFIERRKSPSDSSFLVATNSPDKARLDLLAKKNYQNSKNKNNNKEVMMPGVPYAPGPDIFEIGWVAGTEDRYLELISAEWHNTRVSLRRHIHPDCKNAVRADLEVLSEIRHSNVLLLMGTTHTEEHGLVAIFEPVDCTLFNYIHEQGERISVQGVAKCAGSLAAALKHAHMRGYIHSAISSHCVFLASTGMVKLGGWELATNVAGPKTFHEYEDRLRSEIFKWQAPELLSGHEASIATDIYSLTLLMWEMCTMNIPWNNLSKADLEQRIELPDNTVEDIYIDDEFGDNLAVNMVLLNEDDPADDEDFLPDLLELSDRSHECTEYL
ncbi:inactive serine/threonine-protein kinase TEX14-like [Fopius arisanus]|uniref:Inactive serine/threonine-protein kinase TEX14-like n=1 Tax=Fopius arisanus TaxID=64838 RepID=A0A9R1T4T4_9HYME|nr:PREDICTED: inactive serine/threonine-protein kinase TEX14-like [Fopius arisanus]